jgi:Tol biopolymer transport system component/serine/threonine protein kinase
MTLNAGTLLGRYEIRAHLGTGGMGEVYLAQDTQLERTVALKILPPEFATDQQRMQRFVQEARAASALNHPNIITIHEIGQADATHFIATEFIDGVTLRQHMQGARLSLLEALDVAVQVSGALTAAHQAGVIHRDIKPENIMLRTDGYVKVLDFGLAKPTGSGAASIDTEAQTKMLVNTSPGMIMGTVSYMSPEQTRGLALDGRTDIWSLGVSLYEMLTGRVPFTGETTSDVIVAVLDREPAPLSDYLTDVPAELQRIVRKSLRKDKEERYQTIKDMLVDLRSLKQELEFEAKLERTAVPGFRSGDFVQRTSGQREQAATATEREIVAETESVTPVRNTAGTEAHAVASQSKRNRWLALSLIGALVVAGLGFTAYKLFWHKSGAADVAHFQTIRLSRLTSTGRSVMSSISPDGKYVAHVVNDGAQRSLWVRQVTSTRNVQLVAPAEANYVGITFSHDSGSVYYVRGERNQPLKQLYQISVLGGEPKKVLTDIDSGISFSPDGARFVFLRFSPGAERETDLIIANTDGTGEQKLATRRTPDAWFFPAWSPDGKTIALASINGKLNWKVTLVEVQVADGQENALGSKMWLDVLHLTWLRDGSGLLLLAPADDAPEYLQIWLVDKQSGLPRRVTNDLNHYISLSVTADSKTIATVPLDRVSNIWVAPNADAARARQVKQGSSREHGLAWTPDGRIVYSSNESGKTNLWMMNADGTEPKQLTDLPGANVHPAVSPDGRTIAFVSDRGQEGVHIWKMNLDGSNLTQLTRDNQESFPQFSPDGRWIVYESWVSGRSTIWKIPVDGGQPVQLTNKYSKMPVVSPDGKLIACSYWIEQPGAPFVVALIPFDGGEPVKTLDFPNTAVRWSTDGRSLVYIDTRDTVSNLWSQPIDGVGQPKQLTDWKSERIFEFAWSGDGKQLVLLRGIVTSDVVLINDFKQEEK